MICDTLIMTLNCLSYFYVHSNHCNNGNFVIYKNFSWVFIISSNKYEIQKNRTNAQLSSHQFSPHLRARSKRKKTHKKLPAYIFIDNTKQIGQNKNLQKNQTCWNLRPRPLFSGKFPSRTHVKITLFSPKGWATSISFLTPKNGSKTQRRPPVSGTKSAHRNRFFSAAARQKIQISNFSANRPAVLERFARRAPRPECAERFQTLWTMRREIRGTLGAIVLRKSSALRITPVTVRECYLNFSNVPK